MTAPFSPSSSRASEHPALALLRKAAELTADTGFFLSPAGPLRFAIRGPRTAPPLVILHGLADSIPGWAQALPFLARRHRVHVLDLPGHGLSARPPDWRLDTFAAAARSYVRTLDRPTLVGHSLGGWIGARLALEEPALLSRLVLVNPGGARLHEAEYAGFRSILAAADSRAARRYLRAAFRRPPPLLWLFPGEVVRTMAAEPTRGFLGSLTDRDFLSERDLHGLRVPARLILGAHDRLLPLRSREVYSTGLGVPAVVLEGAAHCPHLETPRALVRAIVE